MFSLNTLNSQNEMNNMEKKKYLSPTITETKIDSEMILMQGSGQVPGPGFMTTEESNQTDGTGISQFMNPLKWFR